jgi:two-component system sensor histidine kinase ChvG|nr:histidine kinase dimerization/phospho-acceptor domain-containing protein [Kofleriaceae bacterium]
MRLIYRLLLINLIVAIVPIAGVSFARMHERQLLAALEADMVHEAELVRTTRPDAAALEAAERETGMWIRVLTPADLAAQVASPATAGRAAAPTGAAQVDDVADRAEVRAALAGRFGSATRIARSPRSTLDTVHLFVALPVLDRTCGGARACGGARVTSIVYVARSTRDVKLQLYALRASMIRVLAIALVVTALLTLLLSMTIARPLAKLTRRAAACGRGGPDELDRRRDEIGQLARAVTAMTDELERRARDARSLAADISHELKTPLAGIRGAAELLADGAADDAADRARFLAMITDDAARIDRLVTRLLELARVDDDRAPPAPVDVAAVARAAGDRRWPAAIAVRADAAVTLGRAPAIASAVDNLIANACEFADPGTAVVVEVARGTRVRVAVSNHGPALSDAARARVWDRFYSTRIASGGSGLGLAIVRSVALAHGGDHGVRCQGGVTTFWFEC